MVLTLPYRLARVNSGLDEFGLLVADPPGPALAELFTLKRKLPNHLGLDAEREDRTALVGRGVHQRHLVRQGA